MTVIQVLSFSYYELILDPSRLNISFQSSKLILKLTDDLLRVYIEMLHIIDIHTNLKRINMDNGRPTYCGLTISSDVLITSLDTP